MSAVVNNCRARARDGDEVRRLIGFGVTGYEAALMQNLTIALPQQNNRGWKPARSSPSAGSGAAAVPETSKSSDRVSELLITVT